MIGKQQNKFVYGFGNFPKAYISKSFIHVKVTSLNSTKVWWIRIGKPGQEI